MVGDKEMSDVQWVVMVMGLGSVLFGLLLVAYIMGKRPSVSRAEYHW